MVTVAANTSGAPAAKTQPLTLTVTALPDYALRISNSPQSALLSTPPTQVTFNGTLTAINGYSTAVNLTCSGNVPTSGCQFSPSASITPSAGGAAFTVSVSSSTSQTYNFNIDASGAGALNASQSAAVVFNSAAFSLPANSGSATVRAGGTAQYTLTFTPTGPSSTFIYPITFAPCAGLPNLSNCTFNPTQIAAGSPATSGTVTLSISTTAPRASLNHSALFYAFWISLPGLALVLAGPRAKRGPIRTVALRVAFGLALLATLFQSACGGGGGSPPSQPGTTPGTYTITINATETSGSTTFPQTTTVSLTVQ
jgi:hypothetical protein